MQEQQEYEKYELAQCELNPGMKAYKRFSEIPADKVSESSLVAWMYHGGKFREIPEEMHTQNLYWTATRWDFGAFLAIDRSKVDDLHGMCLNGMIHGLMSFDWLPPELLTEQFVIDMTIEDVSPLDGADLEDQHEFLLTERVVKEIASRSLSHAYSLYSLSDGIARPLIKDEYLVAAIKNDPRSAWKLNEMGKEGLFLEVLSQGYWPPEESFSDIPGVVAKPTTVAQAYDWYRESEKDSFPQRLYRAWMQAQPLTDLITALQGSKAGLDHLFEHYPEKELRQHLKTHRPLRGRFLENDLGM